MSTEPFIGEIKIFAFDFAPVGYAYCAGQTLSIAQNTALFALIGTIYGGNGQTTFMLPNLQGRMPIGQGQGPGLPLYTIGQQSGVPTTTLTSNNLPPHVHPAQGITVAMPVATTGGDTDSPAGAFLALTTGDFYSSVSTPGNHTGALTVSGQTGTAGAGQPFSIMNPYLALNFCIATVGIFPSRN